jgi:hypothetical protein
MLNASRRSLLNHCRTLHPNSNHPLHSLISMPLPGGLTQDVIQAFVADQDKPTLRAARLACKAFDAASRALDSTNTVTLDLHHAAGALATPLRWSRFPKLRTIELRGWCGTTAADGDQLQPADDLNLTGRCLHSFFGGQQQLAAVTALYWAGPGGL